MKGNAVDYLDSLFKKIGTTGNNKKTNVKEKIPEITQKSPAAPLPKLEENPIINAEYLYSPMGNELGGEITNDPENELRKKEPPSGTEILRKIVNNDEKFTGKLENKNFLIEKYVKKLDYRKLLKKKETKSKFREKVENQIKYYSKSGEIHQYDMYLPLNALWNSYIKEFLADTNQDMAFCEKFLRADFHGAILKVLKAKCKTYEGQSGIIIEEKQRAFVIVTKENKISIILKKNAIFLIDVLGKTLKIYGCNLNLRPTDRLKEKFKMKQAGDFILSGEEGWNKKKKLKT